jgi:hypothetical protein
VRAHSDVLAAEQPAHGVHAVVGGVHGLGSHGRLLLHPRRHVTHLPEADTTNSVHRVTARSHSTGASGIQLEWLRGWIDLIKRGIPGAWCMDGVGAVQHAPACQEMPNLEDLSWELELLW